MEERLSDDVPRTHGKSMFSTWSVWKVMYCACKESNACYIIIALLQYWGDRGKLCKKKETKDETDPRTL